MTKKGIYTIIGFILLMLLVTVVGPYSSRVYDRKYREAIDKNGKVMNARLYMKSTHNGRNVHFKYVYNSTIYTNDEQNDSLYNNLNFGDTLVIKIDTLHPGHSYIIKY